MSWSLMVQVKRLKADILRVCPLTLTKKKKILLSLSHLLTDVSTMENHGKSSFRHSWSSNTSVTNLFLLKRIEEFYRESLNKKDN